MAGRSVGLDVDFTGARRDVMAQSLDELDELVELYPEPAQRLLALTVVGEDSRYPDYLGGGPFTAYIEALPGQTTPLAERIWMSRTIFGAGRLPDGHAAAAGRQVALPRAGSPAVCFVALMAHEYGHMLYRWLQTRGFGDELGVQCSAITQKYIKILRPLTPASFEHQPPIHIPQEIFAELFASRRVFSAVQGHIIGVDLVHPMLDEEALQVLVRLFGLMVDDFVARARQG
jgi:hypothetical protein